MSRSYKKAPWCGDHKGKSKKRMANHAVRNWEKDNLDLSLQGSDYKKLYETWDICDYGWICSWEDYWNTKVNHWYKKGRHFNMPFPNEAETRKEWFKTYKMK